MTDGKAAPPTVDEAVVPATPEVAFKLSSPAGTSGRLYGIGADVYRSDDAGVSWVNLTSYRGVCLLGSGLRAVTASPVDPDDVVVASDAGVWRSLDGGLSWNGLNQFLPNLPPGHLMGLPGGTRGVRLALSGGSAIGVAREVEWAPGEKAAWKSVAAADVDREQNLKNALSRVLKRAVTAIAAAGDYIYAGDSEGRLQVSSDAGVSWGAAFRLGEQGKVEAIWVDANDPRVAVAVLGARTRVTPGAAKPAYVLRSMNGGSFWDDITANLPESSAAHGVAADRAGGAVYVATDAGLFYTTTDLGAAGRPTAWTSLSEQLPAVAATDVKLDSGGNQLFAVLDGYGVYTTIAPHRLRDARVVNAADYSTRPAAPGALLSVLGARVESARSGGCRGARAGCERRGFADPGAIRSQGQRSVSIAPGSIRANDVRRAVEERFAGDFRGSGRYAAHHGRAERSAAGCEQAGARELAHTGSGNGPGAGKAGLAHRVGGAVEGSAAGGCDGPRLSGGSPVEVTQASLAPGYVGFYLIEIQVPRIADTGPSELYLEAEGQQSNRVRLYVEQ